MDRFFHRAEAEYEAAPHHFEVVDVKVSLEFYPGAGSMGLP